MASCLAFLNVFVMRSHCRWNILLYKAHFYWRCLISPGRCDMLVISMQTARSEKGIIFLTLQFISVTKYYQVTATWPVILSCSNGLLTKNHVLTVHSNDLNGQHSVMQKNDLILFMKVAYDFVQRFMNECPENSQNFIQFRQIYQFKNDEEQLPVGKFISFSGCIL